MRRLTLADIMWLVPCSDWTRDRVREAMGGRTSLSAYDVLNAEHVPAGDRVWLLLKGGFLRYKNLVRVAAEFATHAYPWYVPAVKTIPISDPARTMDIDTAPLDAAQVTNTALCAAAWATSVATDEIAERDYQLSVIRTYLDAQQEEIK